MTELVDIRLHHQIAHEIYRQQMMQRLPDPYPSMLPVPAPSHRQLQQMPQRYGLPGADAKLQNADLWSQFHQIGTEMIITKSGRRMFPSLRISLSGLEDDANYCVLLEMVPRGDCRYKFSGSQWVPAGGAEPQSTQRMYLHPDSPALGSHWAAQPVLFNKVKLTNNTLDSCGHIVLTSMHKYQPRLHIIRTSDPSQIPWAPQQAFSFAETEYVAVTAYQNDRITKLKIDNNPFAKGFRESGQSRCKRKLTQSSSESGSTGKQKCNNDDDGPFDEAGEAKRKRSNSFTGSTSSLDDSGLSISSSCSGTSSPPANNDDDIRVCDDDEESNLSRMPMQSHHPHLQHQHHQEMVLQQFRDSLQPSWMDLAFSYFTRGPYPPQFYAGAHQPTTAPFIDLRTIAATMPSSPYALQHFGDQHRGAANISLDWHSPTSEHSDQLSASDQTTSPTLPPLSSQPAALPMASNDHVSNKPLHKKCSFSISAILGCES